LTNNGFKNAAAEFVYTRTYSRWIEELGRRETWPETVQRYIDFIKSERGDKIPAKVLRKIKEYMLEFNVMPSMRALHAAGDAARFDHTTLFNCTFACVNTPIVFAEALYILMCGAGFGFSVRKEDVEKLPTIPKIALMASNAGAFIVEDSKKGWADSVKMLVLNLYSGSDLAINYDQIRPQGARLKTMGGRASGPAPLIQFHAFIRQLFAKAQGRKLTPLECHDILNVIAEVVVVGGVRRSSQISLSDLDDMEMRGAKSGNYPLSRAMANNSAIYEKKPDIVVFMREWAALAESGTGERGIFNLETARETAPKRRDKSLIFGTNPCGEICLRDKEMCNLSEVVIRADDDLDNLLDKVETATWLGVIQSSMTHFPYLSPEWKKNCDEERLLGVSLTGQMDAPHLLTPEALRALKSRALKVSKRAAVTMGLNASVAVTCVKPSGTVSQLVDSSSGVHARHSAFYLRRYRIAAFDPLCKLFKDQGAPMSPENGQRKSDWAKAIKAEANGQIEDAMKVCRIFIPGQEWSPEKVNTWVVSFPVKAPKGAITRDKITAIAQLEHYKKIQTNFCEHNASVTIYVEPHEWLKVGTWVWENWEVVNGISFLPSDGGKYEQAPYEDLTEEEYEVLVKKFPKIDYSKLSAFEREDQTSGSKEIACGGATSCEI
jgi:ribonucleoside-diphosphate reductase alpha chain